MAGTSPPAGGTLSRRTLLEWIGHATVLTLSSDLLLACAEQVAHLDGGIGGPPLGDGPAVPDARPVPDAGLPFAPGTGSGGVFDGWGERTVDPQDLTQILASWRLVVDGMVQEPLELRFSDLFTLPGQSQVTDFHCVEGWSVIDVPWNGVHLSHLLARARPHPGASHITFHTVGGAYNESLPIDVALEPRSLMAYGIAGATLPVKHGFPLRLVVPRLLGYKNAKYVHRLELTDREVQGYWVVAGYPYDGEVPEARLRPGKY